MADAVVGANTARRPRHSPVATSSPSDKSAIWRRVRQVATGAAAEAARAEAAQWRRLAEQQAEELERFRQQVGGAAATSMTSPRPLVPAQALPRRDERWVAPRASAQSVLRPGDDAGGGGAAVFQGGSMNDWMSYADDSLCCEDKPVEEPPSSPGVKRQLSELFSHLLPTPTRSAALSAGAQQQASMEERRMVTMATRAEDPDAAAGGQSPSRPPRAASADGHTTQYFFIASPLKVQSARTPEAIISVEDVRRTAARRNASAGAVPAASRATKLVRDPTMATDGECFRRQ